MRRLLLIPALALVNLSYGLTLGESAPALKVETVVKGTVVDLDRGVHVVEFWATWCGPCKVSIPHLTELAHKYKGKVDFTGVSVWETGPDQLGQVKKFVAAQGPNMDYNVAFDGSSKTMASTWMTAAKQNGIPAAFLVKDGKVLWIGHPMGGLEKAIDQTLAGTFDVDAAKAEFDRQAAEMEKQMQAQRESATLLKPVSDALRAKDYDGALKAIDAIEPKRPDLKARLESSRFSIYLSQGSPKLLALAQRFAEVDYRDNAAMLNSFAWSIVDPAAKVANPNLEAARILAKRAAEASKMKDGSILDTYALVLFKTGDKKQALEVQTQAMEAVKGDKSVDEASLKEMQDRLEAYRKAAA